MSVVSRAPEPLERVRAFVNTLDGGRDDLADWLSEHGLAASARERAWAAEVREALRSLLLSNNGIEVDLRAAGETLDQAARRARLAVRFDSGAPRIAPEGGGRVSRVVGELLAIVAGAAADGTWRRLKACRADDCRWAFYDHARNHSRTWCSMAVCGNRAKARAYRQRH
jgi:predicted RNA-binding Zn ribbon-like protein